VRADPAQLAEDEAAIARVLQAEREAEEAIACCEAECADELARARRMAEDIAARAERRIALLTRRIAAAIEQQIVELESAAIAEAHGGDNETAELARAADALARELTGAAE
jgi:hypothetical protein